MERVAQPNQWEDFSFRVCEVVPDEGLFGAAPRKLFDDGTLIEDGLLAGIRRQTFALAAPGLSHRTLRR